jgi:hypothetical protein
VAAQWVETHADGRRIWDRDHWSIYHSFANDQNRQRLVALAVAEGR